MPCHVALSVACVSCCVFVLELLSSRKDWKKNGKDWQRRRRGCFPTSAYRAYSRCVMVGWRPWVLAGVGRCSAWKNGCSAWKRLQEYVRSSASAILWSRSSRRTTSICFVRHWSVQKKSSLSLCDGECCMLEGCTRTSKKSCRRGAAAGIESPTLGNLHEFTCLCW